MFWTVCISLSLRRVRVNDTYTHTHTVTLGPCHSRLKSEIYWYRLNFACAMEGLVIRTNKCKHEWNNVLTCVFCRRVWSKQRSYSFSSWEVFSDRSDIWCGRPTLMLYDLSGSDFLWPGFDIQLPKSIAFGKERSWQNSDNVLLKPIVGELGSEALLVPLVARWRHFSEQKAGPGDFEPQNKQSSISPGFDMVRI